MSENVPIGHTAEQYTRPNKKVIRSHTIVAPNVILLSGCLGHRMYLRSYYETGRGSREKQCGQHYPYGPELFHSLSAFALLFLLFAKHGLLLALHFFKTRHETGFLFRFFRILFHSGSYSLILDHETE